MGLVLSNLYIRGEIIATTEGAGIIAPPVMTPVSSFTKTVASGNTPLSVTFTDTSTHTPTSWLWTFGDGTTSTSQNPTKSYATAGLYNVTLAATNSAGTHTSEIQTITALVPDLAPVASFTKSATSGTTPLSVTFTDTSINGPTSWLWNFGDGTTSTSQNPTKSYATAGLYNVTLTATDAVGSSTSAAQVITTISPVVNHVYVGTTMYTGGISTVAYPAGTIAGDLAIAILHDFSQVVPTGFTHAFTTAGDAYGYRKTVSFKIVAGENSFTSTPSYAGFDCSLVVIRNTDRIAPEFNFVYSTGGGAVAVNTLRAGTQILSLSDRGGSGYPTISGTQSNKTQHSATYFKGVVAVYLNEVSGVSRSYSDYSDGYGTSGLSMYVLSPPTPQAPVASFTKSTSTGSIPLSVTFTDTSANTPTSWSWNFGDGTSSTARHPTKSYATAGTFNVTLAATNAVGSNTSAAQTITALLAPAGDSYWDGVQLLLHGEGTTLVDSSGNVLTPTSVSNVVTTTEQFKFGAKSVKLVGTSSLFYANSAINNALTGSGNITTPFTFETFAYSTGNAQLFGTTMNGNNGWSLGHVFGQLSVINYSAGGGWSAACQWPSALPTNQWVHVALSYTGTQTFLYVNGVRANQVGTVMPKSSNAGVWLGNYSTSGNSMTGYFDETRLTIGTARYVDATCPVPTGPFPSL